MTTRYTPPPPHPTTGSSESERDDAPSPVARRHLPPTRWSVFAVLLGALGTDLAMWANGPGLAWTLGATAAAGAVAVGARPRRISSWLLVAAVPALAIWCTVRMSPWLIVPDLIAINVCLVLGADLGGRGHWFDQSFARVAVRLLTMVEDVVMGPAWLRPALRSHRDEDGGRPQRDWKPVIGGLVVVVPLVATLGLLLASADAVFASFFDLGVNWSTTLRHLGFLSLGGLAIAALLRKSAASAEPQLATATRASATAGNIVLVGVAMVFALFSASRVLALTGTAERIATTRGLTWAEYARGGFFQLLAVAAITLVVLLVVCGSCDRGNGPQVRLRKIVGLVVVMEILGIVVDAIHRLSGYERAYGLTMLRLYSTGFALWIALVFVIVAVAIALDYRGRRWLSPVILLTLLVGVFVANVVNPEAVVTERNLSGPTRAGETDLTYLAVDLSADALPVLDDHLDGLDEQERSTLHNAVCWQDQHPHQWFNPNFSRDAATRIVERWCLDAHG